MDNQQFQPLNPQPQEEKANIGLAIISFFIPLVGLILFLTKKSEKPKTAKACGIAALISVLLGIVCSVIMSVAGTALFMNTDFDALDEDISYSEEYDLDDADLDALLEDAEN